MLEAQVVSGFFILLFSLSFNVLILSEFGGNNVYDLQFHFPQDSILNAVRHIVQFYLHHSDVDISRYARFNIDLPS